MSSQPRSRASSPPNWGFSQSLRMVSSSTTMGSQAPSPPNSACSPNSQSCTSTPTSCAVTSHPRSRPSRTLLTLTFRTTPSARPAARRFPANTLARRRYVRLLNRRRPPHRQLLFHLHFLGPFHLRPPPSIRRLPYRRRNHHQSPHARLGTIRITSTMCMAVPQCSVRSSPASWHGNTRSASTATLRCCGFYRALPR